MDSDKGGRGAGDEDAGLVDGIVCRVKGAVVVEWCGGQGEEEGG